MKKIAIFSLFLLTIPYISNGFICLSQKKAPSSIKNISSIENDLFELVNKEREKKGLFSLVLSKKLSLLARKHSQDMSASQNLSHLSSSQKSYVNRLVEAGFYFISSGENIAFSETFMAEFINHSFMESPEHRENILESSFNHVGIGIALGKQKGYYITMDFLQLFDPKTEKEVKEEIRERINNLRRENSLSPLQFAETADEFARAFSFRKAERRLPPQMPSYFGENHIIYTASPSLHKAYSEYKDIVVNSTYKKAGVGVVFSRNLEYRGGAYFITIILFPDSKQKSWSKKDLRQMVFQTVNKLRKNNSLCQFKMDKSLVTLAEKIVKEMLTERRTIRISPKRRKNIAVLSYVTEDPTLLSPNTEEKLRNNLIFHKKIGIGIQFGKNKISPQGAFWITILLEE
ncbi:MAG: CAP domain-containing protein [Candidatus Aminicenantaceae bacterium]